MAKKASKKADDVNQKIVEELLSKGDPSQLFGKDGLFNNSPYAKRLFSRKFTSSFIDAIFAATNNLYLIAK